MVSPFNICFEIEIEISVWIYFVSIVFCGIYEDPKKVMNFWDEINESCWLILEIGLCVCVYVCVCVCLYVWLGSYYRKTRFSRRKIPFGFEALRNAILDFLKGNSSFLKRYEQTSCNWNLIALDEYYTALEKL